MKMHLQRLGPDVRPTLGLAGPVILAEIGWVAMGMVDTLMVGRLGPVAIGAVGIGSSLFIAFAIFGMGLLLGLDTLVSQAHGAGQPEECRRWLLHGVALSLVSAPAMMLLGSAGLALLPSWGFSPEVLQLTAPYLRVLLWSLLPLLLYATFRRYLQARGVVRQVTAALIVANVVNVVANWILIFGHLGAPALGTVGSAWATLASRVVLAGYLLFVVVRVQAREALEWRTDRWRLERQRLLRLVRLGLPAAGQITLEAGVFSAATALAGRLDTIQLAAHQITLHYASLTFMVPLGMASAGAVRVGHAIGRRDPDGAARAGWTALALGVSFMASASLAFLICPQPLLAMFTADPGVVSTGASLLFIAACFQPFDGVQGVATGVLRGAGDTRLPMLVNLGAHWCLGLPLGYSLCFWIGWGVRGLWVGLGAGLVMVALVLIRVWMRQARAFHAQLST